MARLLGPEDYGIAAAAAIVLSFSQVLWEAGMGRAIVQRPGDVDRAANVAFWTNVVLGLGVYGLLSLAADWIAAQLFREPRVASVLRVQGLAVLLGALGSVHTALFQRNMDFKTLFRVRVWSTGAPAAISVPVAALGGGYWALVAGSLVGSATQALLLWRSSHWRPSLVYDRTIATQLVSFGCWATAASLLGWFYVWADTLLVGHYLDSHSLGQYRAGSVFVSSLFSLGLSPILPVLYSVFSKIQNDRERLNQALLKSVRWIGLITLSGGAVLFALRDPVARIVFGNRWTGIDEVVGWLALTLAVSWLVGANPEAYRAVGRPDVETKIMLMALPSFIAAYVATLPHGLRVFLYARFLVMLLIGLPIHLVFVKKVLRIRILNFVEQFLWPMFAAGAIMAISQVVAPSRLWPDMLHMILVASLLIGGVAVWPQRRRLGATFGGAKTSEPRNGAISARL